MVILPVRHNGLMDFLFFTALVIMLINIMSAMISTSNTATIIPQYTYVHDHHHYYYNY